MAKTKVKITGGGQGGHLRLADGGKPRVAPQVSVGGESAASDGEEAGDSRGKEGDSNVELAINLRGVWSI